MKSKCSLLPYFILPLSYLIGHYMLSLHMLLLFFKTALNGSNKSVSSHLAATLAKHHDASSHHFCAVSHYAVYLSNNYSMTIHQCRQSSKLSPFTHFQTIYSV